MHFNLLTTFVLISAMASSALAAPVARFPGGLDMRALGSRPKIDAPTPAPPKPASLPAGLAPPLPQQNQQNGLNPFRPQQQAQQVGPNPTLPQQNQLNPFNPTVPQNQLPGQNQLLNPVVNQFPKFPL